MTKSVSIFVDRRERERERELEGLKMYVIFSLYMCVRGQCVGRRMCGFDGISGATKRCFDNKRVLQTVRDRP